SGPPSQPEPYELSVMKPLPAQHLPLKITPAAPIATLQPGYAYTTWRISTSAYITSNAGCGYAPPETHLIVKVSNGTTDLINDMPYTQDSSGTISYDFDSTSTISPGHVAQYHDQRQRHYTSSSHYDATGIQTG